MVREFKYVRFDRNLHAEPFPCEPILEFVQNAMCFFVPRTPRSRNPHAKQNELIEEMAPELGLVMGAMVTMSIDREVDAGTERQREFEETVAFIEKFILESEISERKNDAAPEEKFDRETIVDTILTDNDFSSQFCPGTWLIYLLRERMRDVDEPLIHSLSNGRAIGEIEMIAAAVLLECELSVESYIRREIDEFARLMSDMMQCAKYAFYPAQRSEQRRIEARTRGKKAHKDKPKQLAMIEVRQRFDQWEAGIGRYKNDAHFALEMQRAFPIISNESSIKNAVGKWRKERKSSR